MTLAPVSIVVVSRGRPDTLMRCLTGLEQLDHPEFEIVVVADPDGLAAVGQSRFAGQIKAVAFDVPNISLARNAGLAVAAAEIVAFIDDDAVPEPTWLTRLAAAFTDAGVVAAGGYVRGRNGISFQNRARSVDALGDHAELHLDGNARHVFSGKPGRAIKTEGTNCAFRRTVLCQMGGFDPAFAFYMDETDVNLRLAEMGHATAIVPGAEVHHGFAASARRLANRMPRDLFDVGASHMLLLRKHAAETDPEPVLARLRAEQRARLLRHMVAGTCEPRDVACVLETMEAGIASGRTRRFGSLPPIGVPSTPFQRFVPETTFSGACWLAGRPWQAARLRREATRLVAEGRRVSLYLFGPTTLYHRVRFDPAGFWEQRGGIWGRSERSASLVSALGFQGRLRREIARVGDLRNLTNS